MDDPYPVPRTPYPVPRTPYPVPRTPWTALGGFLTAWLLGLADEPEDQPRAIDRDRPQPRSRGPDPPSHAHRRSARSSRPTIPPDTILGSLADQGLTLGPVLHPGDGRLQLLTKPDSYQPDRYDSAAAAILYLPPGSLILLPPSRLADGQFVTWLRHLDALASLPNGTNLFWTLTDLPANRHSPTRASTPSPTPRQQQHDQSRAW